MIVYHGTVDAYLPSIEKLGLKFTPSNSFKIDTLDGPLEIEHGVYLTTDREAAKRLAAWKADYLRTLPGNLVTGTTGLDFKARSAEVLDATPVVLDIDLPAELSTHLRIDPQWTSYGLICSCAIPPACIVRHEEVRSVAF